MFKLETLDCEKVTYATIVSPGTKYVDRKIIKLSQIYVPPFTDNPVRAKGLDLPAELIAWQGLQSNAPEAVAHHITPNPNKSKQLASLNLASTKFWANADRDDKTTWPNTKDIIAWLVVKGFTESLAQSGATIIRPEWAGAGRR